MDPDAIRLLVELIGKLDCMANPPCRPNMEDAAPEPTPPRPNRLPNQIVVATSTSATFYSVGWKPGQ